MLEVYVLKLCIQSMPFLSLWLWSMFFIYCCISLLFHIAAFSLSLPYNYVYGESIPQSLCKYPEIVSQAIQMSYLVCVCRHKMRDATTTIHPVRV